MIAKSVYYSNLQQLQGVIQKVCFIEDEDEVATLLDYYHDLGVIVKYRDTVVLQAQWLIDVFRQLITIRPFDEMVRKKHIEVRKYILILVSWERNSCNLKYKSTRICT